MVETDVKPSISKVATKDVFLKDLEIFFDELDQDSLNKWREAHQKFYNSHFEKNAKSEKGDLMDKEISWKLLGNGVSCMFWIRFNLNINIKIIDLYVDEVIKPLFPEHYAPKP